MNTLVNKQVLSKTRTWRFFLNKYESNSMRAAVERAAAQLRAPLLGEYETYPKIPVDTWQLADSLNIKIKEYEGRNGKDSARLVPTRGGFTFFIRSDLPKTRKRTSIAHELGHTLFYINSSHQIALIESRELLAEEIICWKVASALLMPHQAIMKLAQKLRIDSAWAILQDIEKIARCFGVSVEALVPRFGHIEKMCVPHLIICSKYAPHPVTNTRPLLRLQSFCSLGKTRSLIAWHNQSLSGLNLLNAEFLFRHWKELSLDRLQVTIGRYTYEVVSGLVRATPDSFVYRPEEVNITKFRNKKWSKNRIPMNTAHCLYTWKNASEHQIYLISILRTAEKI